MLANVFHKRPTYYFSSEDGENEAIDALRQKISGLGEKIRIKSDGSGRDTIPGISKKVKRILEVAGEGHMPGYAAVSAYLSENGIDKIWPCRFDRFEELGSQVEVHTGLGIFRSTYLVIASGVSDSCFTHCLGKNPVRPRSGQLVITDRAACASGLRGSMTSASYLMSKTNEKLRLSNPPIVVDPLTTGQYLVGSSREPQADSSKTDFNTVKNLLSHASACYLPLSECHVIRVFAGVRAAVEDGYPLIGPVSKNERVLFACGFEGDGICLSGIVGREVGDFITGKEFTEDIKLFSPRRFML